VLLPGFIISLIIPVTRRVKGYIIFGGKYLTVKKSQSSHVRLSVRPYERWDLGNDKSYKDGIWHANSWGSFAEQICFSKGPRPL